MDAKNQDKLNSMEIKKDGEKNEILEHRRIEEGPFTAVRLDDKWFLTMGKYRLTEPMGSYEEVEENSRNADWLRIMQVMRIVAQETIEEQTKKQNP